MKANKCHAFDERMKMKPFDFLVCVCDDVRAYYKRRALHMRRDEREVIDYVCKSIKLAMRFFSP